MDKVDLRLLYRRETGEWVADQDSLQLPERTLLSHRTQKMMRYIDWLENKMTEK